MAGKDAARYSRGLPATCAVLRSCHTGLPRFGPERRPGSPQRVRFQAGCRAGFTPERAQPRRATTAGRVVACSLGRSARVHSRLSRLRRQASRIRESGQVCEGGTPTSARGTRGNAGARAEPFGGTGSWSSAAPKPGRQAGRGRASEHSRCRSGNEWPPARAALGRGDGRGWGRRRRDDHRRAEARLRASAGYRPRLIYGCGSRG